MGRHLYHIYLNDRSVRRITDTMQHLKTKFIYMCAALVILISLTSCQLFPFFNREGSPNQPETQAATADEAITASQADNTASTDVSESQSSTLPDQADATAITYTAPTQSATSPSVEEILSSGSSDPNDIYDATGFVNIKDVIPEVQTEIRYASAHNFVGEVISGYDEPIAIMTKEAASALMGANNDLKEQGYTVKIFDAYRPQSAVDHFVTWSYDYDDQRMKSEFYPELDKSTLFNSGYIAYQSGHSKGSTIDLTLVELSTGEEVDMGGSFDYFGSLSHPDYTGISSEQYQNRMTLRNAMVNNGFSPLYTEWWHFSLNNEPYPNTFFDFPVSSSSLSGS